MTEDESATLEKTRLVRPLRWNGPPLLLAADGVKVLVAGTGTHRPTSRLPQVPAVPATLDDLGRCLVERAGVAPANLTVLLDPATPANLGEALERAAGEATRVLLFHFVGHAVFGPDNEPHLATRATVDLAQGAPGYQALPYGVARRILAASRADLVVVVLDCCFTAGARPVPAKALDGVFETGGRGAYVLASSSRDENSWALPGVRHTALTGALLRLLNEGDPAGPPAFTLDHVHHHLSRTLPDAGFPRPRRQAGEPGDLPPLAVNPAHAAPRSRPGPPIAAPGDLDSPYRGLAAYEEPGSFFGREDETRALVTRVRQTLRAVGPPVMIGTRAYEAGAPLILTGPSGCGKTSLLRAGLIPALRDELTQVWLTPGARPLTRLTTELAALTGGDPGRLRAVVESDPGAVRRGIPQGTLVVVDAFEEVFTACSDEGERRRFAGVLAELARSAAVVLSVRGDLFGRCASYPGLVETMRRPEILAPMGADGLRRVIEEPAVRSGLTVEAGLTDLILEDLRALDGDWLPLLSHALLATWQRRTGGVLTMAGYRAAGGVARAVAMSGEETLRRLGTESEPVARTLLTALVHVDEQAGAAGRRVPVAEVSSGPASVEGQVLAEFVRARLVTLDGDEVEPAHDVLARAWPRLANWTETRRAALLVRRRLAEDARMWDQDGRAASYLYTDDRLTTASAALAEPGAVRDGAPRDSVPRGGAGAPLGPGDARAGGEGELPLEGEFLVQREFLEASRQRLRRRTVIARSVTATLAVLLLVATAGGITALLRARDANRLAAGATTLRDQALSRQIAAAANAAQDTSLGAQLALAAYRVSATPEARGALLGSLSRPVGARMAGHVAPVERVAYRPDGRVVVTASGDFTARLWNVADPLRPKSLSVVRGHTGGVVTAAFSPDGRTLATGSADGTARLWNVSDPAKPRALATLKRHKAQVGSVAFGPKGDTLVTASRDKTMRLWNVKGAARSVSSYSLTAEPTRAVFGPDGSMVALTAADGTITLLDVRDPALPRKLAGLTSQDGAIRGVAFRPNGLHLATASSTGTVQVWDITGARLVGTGRGHAGAVEDVAFSPDGAILASASADATVGLWSMENPREPALTTTVAGSPDAVTGVAFSPDGRRLATASADGVARLWNVTNAARTAPRARLAGHTGPVHGLAIAKSGRVLATASEDKTVRLWDLSDPAAAAPQATLSGHTGQVVAAAFSPDGRRLVTASLDGTAKIWDVGAAKVLGTLTGHTGGVRSVAYAPDGRMAVTIGQDGRTLLWNVAKPAAPRQVSAIGTADGRLNLAVFRPNGRVLATGSGTSSVRLWDLAKPAKPVLLAGFAAHPGGVLDLRFSPDGATLATASSDGTARLWDLARPGKPRRVADLTGHSADVTGLAFAADGRTLYTASQDTTIRVWNVVDPATPALWAVLAGRGAAADVEVNTDGTVLASADGAAAQLWGLDVEQASANVCEASGTPISRAEWTRHIPGRPYTPPCPA